MRIRSRLLALVFTILAPSIVGAVLGIYLMYDAQQQSYRESIQDLADAKARLLDKEFTERIRILETLSRSPTITDNNLQGFYRFAREVTSTRDSVIVLSDLSGQQFLNSRKPYGTPDLPKITPSIQAKRQELGPDAAIVSNIYFAPIGNSHSFAVQVPVKRHGQILYYVSMGAYTNQLQQLLDEQKLPEGWIAAIVDRQGVVAARTVESDKFVGRNADATLVKRISLEKQGTNDGVTLDGVPVTAFFSQAPQSEWSLIVSVPRSALIRPAVQATAFVALITLLLLGLGSAAAVMIARKTAKPMEALRQTATDLGQGKAVAKQSTGVLEIDAVRMAMAQASDRIVTAKADLEQRVADAVESAERSQKALLQAQKLEALGRLTGGIAHDFNNVMQTLTTGLHVILLSSTESRIKQTVEACQRAVERAAELTRQLMVFGRVQEARLETLDLALQLEVIEPLLRGAIRSNIDLQIEPPLRLWPVTVDPVQLELALLNVVINARDAMPAGGRIVISAHNLPANEAPAELDAGEYLHIAVKDTGDGMSPEVLQKALDPFFTTKPVGQGSGMGLAQAYGFTKQNGGGLAIKSQSGMGTTISFYLPRSQQQVSLTSPTVPKKALVPVISGGRLLFVEDDPLVSAVVAPALRAAGFQVHEASNADEALRLLSDQGPFDIVFSDIIMPGEVTGLELAEHVKQRYPQTRIVLATGYTEHRTIVPGVKVLGKPYDIAEALAIISGA